ncbi:MAG: hypothetical protein JWM17_1166 [Actinobacteria bacterium]|jgi:hypothetical protein|nr:hypothetical protein [Actinomycetota bacterium]MEA2589264.1 hypothetical protein [Actinomycetota bacterium]
MIGDGDLQWPQIAPDGAVAVTLPLWPPARKAVRLRLRELPEGAVVALCDAAPGSRGRCRRFASSANVRLEREYLAVPTLHSAAFLVQDAPGPVSYFWHNLAAVPPGGNVLRPILGGLLRLPVGPDFSRLLGWVVPGRIALGRVASS